MMSKQKISAGEVSSMDSKSVNAKSNATSILNFDCPSSSSTPKKKESFIKRLPVKQTECYECKKTFPSFSEVVTHLKLIHNACAFPDCSKLSNFKLHSSVCANRGLGCAICCKKFQEKHLLLMHFNEHIDAAFYACDVCREGFQQRKDLQKHFFQIHNKFLSIPVTPALSKTVYQKCNQCSKYFKLFAEFQEHVSSCSSLTYACFICKVSFTSISTLDEHKQTEHKSGQALKGYQALKQGKRYFCGICYLGFSTGIILKEHVLTHEAETNFICDVCNVSFSCDNELQAHYLQHIEEHYVMHDVISQHSCSSCTKTFKTLSELKSHLTLKNCKNTKSSFYKKVTTKVSNDAYDEHLTSDKENSRNNSETTLECMSDSPFDFSNIPVYVLKVGEDLLNCEDSQCVIVMDLTSLFVLQRGMCASENRMPDLKNSEVYSETEVVDASLLENHMLSILSPCNVESSTETEKTPDIGNTIESYLEKAESGNMETIVLNINESNNDAQCQSVGEEDFMNSESVNGKFDFLVYNVDDAAEQSSDIEKVICENKMSFINEYIESSDTINKELLIENDNSLDISGLYICNICKQVFSSKTSLGLHMKGSHTGFDCYQCGDSFSSESELKNHEKVHLKIFHCDLCDVSYPKELLLKNHKLTAHGAATFSCNLCNKIFISKNDYIQHMLLHSGENSSTKCEECGKTYASVSNYIRHKASHQEKIKYVCTICDKSFVSHSHLKLHLPTHMRKSPYNCQCLKCKMYFPPRLIAKHLEKHVNIVPLS